MARAIATLLVACALLDAGAARAQSRPAFAARAGYGYVVPSGDVEKYGGGNGFYADVQLIQPRRGWLKPRLYAGALFAFPARDCDPGVTPCDVSARLGLAGAKVRMQIAIPWVAPYLELGIGASAGRFRTRIGTAADVAWSGVTYHVPFAFGFAMGKRHRWQLEFGFMFHPEVKQTQGTMAFGIEWPETARGAEIAAPAQEPAPAEAGAAPPGPEPSAAEAAPAPAEEPAAVPAVQGKRGKTYLAGWLGYGGGFVSRREESTGFLAFSGIMIPQSAGVGLGLPVGRRLLLGAEWNGTFGFDCFVSMNSASGACERVVVIQQVLAMATFFPRPLGAPEVAPAGIFVRAGAGLALLNAGYSPETAAEKALTGATPATTDWKRKGAGALLGVGASARVNARWTLDAGLDLALQWYGRSPAWPELSFSTIVHGGLSFH